MYIVDKDGLGVLFNCASTDAIGSAVRMVSSTTVTTADSSDPSRMQVIGFIRAKPTPTTCYIVQNYYYSAASGFSGFSGLGSSYGNGIGSPVYLTNSSGFSGQPGSNPKILGESISPREALLNANPVNAMSSPFGGFKNRFINGDMQIAQRGAGPTASPGNGSLNCDRWYNMYSYGGTLTVSQDTDVPTIAQAGRKYFKSLKFSSTQDNVVATGDIVGTYQVIEGYNICDILGDGYNTGFTISFWVKSSTVGIYSCTITDATITRVYAAEYTVFTANTWEKKTITVTSAPSGGTWSSTTAAGCFVFFTLMAGSTWNSTTPNTWSTVTDERASPNQVNWCGPAGTSTFNLTGVQFEAGINATPYEFRPYPIELQLCQRYCWQINSDASLNQHFAWGAVPNGATSTILAWCTPPVTMRAIPTLAVSAVADLFGDDTASVAALNALSLTTNGASPNMFYLTATQAGSTWTGNRPARLFIANNTNRYVRFTAEL